MQKDEENGGFRFHVFVDVGDVVYGVTYKIVYPVLILYIAVRGFAFVYFGVALEKIELPITLPLARRVLFLEGGVTSSCDIVVCGFGKSI